MATKNPVQEISYAPSGHVWRVTFDGRVLGDSRGYAMRDEAREAALAIVENERMAACSERRHAERVFRPYF